MIEDLWLTGDIQNQFVLFIGGVFGLLYFVALIVGYTQRRTLPNVVALTSPDIYDRHSHEYIVVLKTSIIPLSSCPSAVRVYIQLHGSFHNSPWFLLRTQCVTKDILSTGSVDIFVVHTEDDLGKITAISFEIFNDSLPKSSWRLISVEVHCPKMRRTVISESVPKLVCNDYLRKNVMLLRSNFVKKSRMSVKSYLHDLFIGHQWLAMTTSHTRFGAYTSFVNLQMFFCIFALHLFGNLISFIITSNTTTLFEITKEEIFGCLITTAAVVFISCLFESIFRNIRPSSDIKKKFEFLSLQYLKRRNIELEQSYEVYDSMFEGNGDESSQWIEERIIEKDHEKSALRVKTKRVLSGEAKHSNMEALQLAAEITREENVSANIQCFSVTSLENKVSAIGNLLHNESESSSVQYGYSVDKNIYPVSEDETKVKYKSEFEHHVVSAPDMELAASEFTFHSVSSSNVTEYDRSGSDECLKSVSVDPDKVDLDNRSAAEASDSACNCCMPICCQKFQKTLPFIESCQSLPNFMYERTEFYSALDLANHYAKVFLSSLYFLLDKSDTPLIAKCISCLQESLAKSSVYLLHISDCLNNTSTAMYSCIDFKGSDIIQKTSTAFFSCQGDDEDFTIPDTLRYQTEHEGNLPPQSSSKDLDKSFKNCNSSEKVSLESVNVWTVDSEQHGFDKSGSESWLENTYKHPGHEERDGTSNNLHQLENQDLGHCNVCSEMNPVWMGMSLTVVSQAVAFLPYIVQVELEASDSEISELQEKVLKKFGDMIMTCLVCMNALHDKMEETVKTDDEMLLGQSISSVVLSRAIKQRFVEFKVQEYLKQVNIEANALYVWALNQALVELHEEMNFNATVKEICKSAVADATKEVWADFQDPVYMFSESVLKLAFVELVHRKHRKEYVYKLLHYASSAWVRELHELPMSADMLLTQSLIFRFESDVHRMCQYFKTRSEYSEVEQKLCQMCLEVATEISKLILHEVCNKYKACREKVAVRKVKFLKDCISLQLYQILDLYVEKIEMLSHSLLHDAFLNLLSRSLVQNSVQRGKVKWRRKCLREIRYKTPQAVATGNESEFQEIKTDFQQIKSYLGCVSQDIRRENGKALRSHLQKVSRRHKEHVTINFQNIVDSFYATDNLPREFSEEELYAVEWFVTGKHKKPFPFWVKPVLILLVAALTICALAYVVLKGAELTTIQTQEWIVFVLIGLFLFALVCEPLKVAVMMLSGEYRPYKEYF